MNIFYSIHLASLITFFKKTERYFACAKSVLDCSQKFLEYQETRLFDFAQYFFKKHDQRQSSSTKYANNFAQQGYVAITTVLIVGVVLLVTGIGVTANSINEMQSSLAESKKEVSIGSVEGCIEDVLMRINKTDSTPATITLPTGSCNVTINSHVGSAWDLTVSGTFGGYQKTIRVTATRTNLITVNSWLEI